MGTLDGGYKQADRVRYLGLSPSAIAKVRKSYEERFIFID